MHFLLCIMYSKTVNNHMEQFVNSSGKVRLIKWSQGVNQTTFLWEACRSVLIIYTKREFYIYTVRIDRVYNWFQQVWPSQRDDSSALKQNNTVKERWRNGKQFSGKGSVEWSDNSCEGILPQSSQISLVFPYTFQTVRPLVGEIIRAEGMRVGRGNNVMTLGILLEFFFYCNP